ncbi:dipeptide/oligopeptide/nickel ABC transporter permease/ATP-binding protein [Desulfotalea psychrophila]|uniref:Probable oligopeptide ABC transporter, ATP-binding protein n=1 Tax=Desulfotalea psychrophila (strain LSv54 / DSM 12343) TaxID=177439 RepID=Q6AP17_DESPS|nr:dipeptide/oligopeptide/nickel ABC transporter permease/ATP-binding protein [Desulfotalea psychrophila]CAG35907.1 probable oligopeptide ABC transporter, ATP-binding protein [Desulfotalea psychrophila LSv54]
MHTILKIREKTNAYIFTGTVLLAIVFMFSTIGSLVSAFDPLLTAPAIRLTAPGTVHWMGTDDVGRDVFTRVICGIRMSMIIGFAVALISGLVGTLAGVSAAYYPVTSKVIMRIVDSIMAFPTIILAIILAGIMGAGMRNIIIALSISYFPMIARVVRNATAEVLATEYVESAEVLGKSNTYIIFRYILPNIASPLIVQMTYTFAMAILNESILSFLGVGIQIPTPSLGGMASDGRNYISIAPWIIGFPGLVISWIVLSLDLLGDGLREIMDPKGRVAPTDFQKNVAPPQGADKTRDIEMQDLLRIENLTVVAADEKHTTKIVSEISLAVRNGETMGIIGESGCGKSITAMSILKLTEPNIYIDKGHIDWGNICLSELSESSLRKICGKEIGMIFQEPMTSLNPVFTIKQQLSAPIRLHLGLSKTGIHQRCIRLMQDVGIKDPEKTLKSYPHELSGGMCQRVAIAIAISCDPQLLIADEPTTALDVTIQAQILGILKKLIHTNHMALLIISHDMGVIASLSENITVMYGGEIVEQDTRDNIIEQASHPYTKKLIGAAEELYDGTDELTLVRGNVPLPGDNIIGCKFAPRCTLSTQKCHTEHPPLTQKEDGAGTVRCWNYL